MAVSGCDAAEEIRDERDYDATKKPHRVRWADMEGCVSAAAVVEEDAAAARSRLLAQKRSELETLQVRFDAEFQEILRREREDDWADDGRDVSVPASRATQSLGANLEKVVALGDVDKHHRFQRAGATELR